MVEEVLTANELPAVAFEHDEPVAAGRSQGRILEAGATLEFVERVKFIRSDYAEGRRRLSSTCLRSRCRGDGIERRPLAGIHG